MSYQDPKNIDEILLNFPASGAKDIFKYVQLHLPNWIVDMSKQFSVDLGKNNLQWAVACNEMKVDPQKVLLVSDTCMEERRETPDKYKLIQTAIEKLSTAGFVVVPIKLFTKCSNISCGEIIVSEKVLTDNNLIFSGKCQGCYKYDPRAKGKTNK